MGAVTDLVGGALVDGVYFFKVEEPRADHFPAVAINFIRRNYHFTHRISILFVKILKNNNK